MNIAQVIPTKIPGLWVLGVVDNELQLEHLIAMLRKTTDKTTNYVHTEYGRTVGKYWPDISRDEGGLEWHQDNDSGGHKPMIACCLKGPGTEFAPFTNDHDMEVGKVRFTLTFPPGYVALVDNRKVIHRTPPWLPYNRYIHRWMLHFDVLRDISCKG